MHRIGQHQPTTVWMYVVEDTVEKSIYDISMRRYSGRVERSEEASLESKIDAANSMELEQAALGNLLAKKSSGGEVVGKKDLWDCLFHHRPGQTYLPQERGRDIVRHLGVAASEGRLDLDGGSANSV